MNDNTMKIMRIIFAIRECLKEELDNFPISCCFESSLVTAKVFTGLGYDTQVIEGKFDGIEHYWNIINGFLCDLSSDQFGQPFGIIENQRDYCKIDQYDLKEQLEIFNSEEDDNLYEDLKAMEVLVNKIAYKCLRRVKVYKCA